MRLLRMTASFGRLDRAVLEPGPGLNILQAPNEGGKSTWAAFLRVMLYGLDTRDRDRKDHIADKNRYRPWSGGPMEGTLECLTGGRHIVLRRYTRGGAPMGAFQAVYADTGLPVEGLTGENCGRTLTGVSREVFERSAFLGQSGLAVDQTPELERRIAALVTTGEERVSYTQTEGRLREWLRRRRYNGSGLLPRLEAELGEVEDTLARLAQAQARARSARAELERLKGEKTGLEAELERQDRARRRALDLRFTRAQEDLRQAEERMERLKADRSRFGPLPDGERLRRAQGELSYLRALDEEVRQGERALEQARQRARQADEAARDPVFDGLTGEQAAARAAEDLAAFRAGESLARRCRRRAPVLLGAGLALLALGLGADLGLGNGLSLGTGLGAAACIVLAALGIGELGRARRARKKAGALLARCGADSPEAALRLAEDYRARQEAAAAAREQAGRVRSALADRMSRREVSRSDLLDFVRGFAPEVKDLFGCSAALSRALELEEQERLARTRLEGARLLYETLRDQGGRMLTGDEPPLPAPAAPRAETAARLAETERALESARARLDRAEGERQALGDPCRLEARREELAARAEQARQDCLALEAALDALKEANTTLQERFSPELNRRAGAWMERLTGGRYRQVTLDRALRASALERDGLIPRPLAALSQGTADQLYLAVRLAICQMALPGEDPCPLVLDDALANFDDGRLALALEALYQLAQERQVLLFTCHSREAAFLAGRPGVHTAPLQS